MKIVGYLKKQPKWKAILIDDKYVHTGWAEVNNIYNHAVRNKKKEEIDVPILEGSLKLVGVGRGRSSVIFEFEDINDGTKYSAGCSAAHDMFLKSVSGEVHGYFTIVKQGTQMSIAVYNGKIN